MIETHERIHGSRGLAYAHQVLHKDPGSARLGHRAPRLLGWIEAHQGALQGGTAVLCHGDYGTENMILRPSGEIAIVDWEFACAGPALLDLGHLLRTPLAQRFERCIAQGYGGLPTGWAEVARMQDLIAWLNFLDRENAVPEAIREAIRAIDRLTS